MFGIWDGENSKKDQSEKMGFISINCYNLQETSTSSNMYFQQIFFYEEIHPCIPRLTKYL